MRKKIIYLVVTMELFGRYRLIILHLCSFSIPEGISNGKPDRKMFSRSLSYHRARVFTCYHHRFCVPLSLANSVV